MKTVSHISLRILYTYLHTLRVCNNIYNIYIYIFSAADPVALSLSQSWVVYWYFLNMVSTILAFSSI